MKTRKARWWLLYTTVPLMLIALVIESRMTYTQTMHQVGEIGIVVATFGLMALWLKANRTGLENEECQVTYSAAVTPEAEPFLVDFSESFRANEMNVPDLVLAGAPDIHHAKYN